MDDDMDELRLDAPERAPAPRPPAPRHVGARRVARAREIAAGVGHFLTRAIGKMTNVATRNTTPLMYHEGLPDRK